MFLNWNKMFRLTFITGLLLVWTLCEIVVIRKQKDKIFSCHVLFEVSMPMWSLCAQFCSRVTLCKSINFIAWNNTCQINYDEPIGDMDGLVESIGNSFVAASTFPKELAGPCKGHDCKINEVCIPKSPTYACVPLLDHTIGTRERIIVSQGKATGQSSTFHHYESRLGFDGVKAPDNFFHTLDELEPFWWVNIGQVYKIQKVVSTNRMMCNQCKGRLKKMFIHVGKSLDACQMKLCGQFIGPATPNQIIVTPCFALPEGQIVKLTSVNTAPDYFHLSEVETNQYRTLYLNGSKLFYFEFRSACRIYYVLHLFKIPEVVDALSSLHDKYVVVPADKASNNIVYTFSYWSYIMVAFQKLCSIRKYVSNTGHEWFDLGCSSQKRCIPIISIPVVGKRHVSTKTSSKFKKEAKSEKPSQTFRSTTETVVCEKCCTTDQCNARLLCDSLDCDPNPCTHGVCKSSLRGYSCACHQGYYGSICDKIIDYCDPDPCVHGICKSSLQGYHCTCQYGYDGSKCDQLKDYCDPNPCVHGVCKSTLQGYSCTCESGYQGSKCDKFTVDHFDLNSCSNMTSKHVALTYSCTCEAGHPRYKKDKDIVAKRLFTSHYVWKWSDCSKYNPNTRRISFANFDISPKPIRLPGNLNIHIKSNTANEHLVDRCELYRLNVTMDKKLLGHWHAVPCRKRFGTCSYEFCGFLQMFGEHLCPQAKTFHSLPTTCACPSGNVNFQSTWNWKSTEPSWDFLLNGDFRARVEIMKGHYIVGCLSAEWSITLPCNGFLCGRR